MTPLCAQHPNSASIGAYPEVRSIEESGLLKTPSVIRFSPFVSDSRDTASDQEAIHRLFGVDGHSEIALDKEIQYHDGIVVRRYRRFYKGIPFEHGQYVTLAKAGMVQSIHAEHYPVGDINVVPLISEVTALNSTLEILDSKLYAWESTQQLLENSRSLPTTLRVTLKAIAESEYPVGELVIVRDYGKAENEFVLAYKFEIESVIPLFKDRVYINAQTGSMMLRDPIIKHGSGDTRYAGERSFPTSLYNTIGSDTFQLRGIEPSTGILCETRSVNGFGGLPLSIASVYALSSPILDGDEGDPCSTDGTLTIAETGDDIWHANEHRPALFDTAGLPLISCCPVYTPHPGTCNEIRNDDVALDAQWGASTVAKYWMLRHGWNSIDNQGGDIISFVHYGDAYNNAFWNGSFMTYGDGTSQKPVSDPNGDYAPFTSLDICGHETGHAICSNTSDLVYQKESGALNEALSDIWAAAIERYVLDSVDSTLLLDPFGIGEQIDERDDGLPPGDPDAYAIRWMDDPNAGANPDTYNGTYYFPTGPPICPVPNLATDYCGVHLNSGILNKWFYFLATGSGKIFSPGRGFNGPKAAKDDEINDLGNTYHVDSIGFEKAEKITFLAETLLTPNAQFIDMRHASIEAARALYGLCSFEEMQTTNAWYAVGVGEAFDPCSPRIEFGDFNPQIVTERADSAGCQASSIVYLAIHGYLAEQTIQFQTGGNAIEGIDYDLEILYMTFDGTETKLLGITIYDDKVVELSPDTLLLSFMGGLYADTARLIIIDDDVTPVIGDAVTLLDETFSADSIPDEWQQFAVNIESGNHWEFNGVGTASGKAYVSIPDSPLPVYNQSAFSHVRLVSPLLDARGRSKVTVSFDWVAGGEVDLVETTVIFDYGTFQSSYDGREWTDIENFVGSQGGQVPDSATFIGIYPELDNRAFYLGFRWYNDGLIGSGFSFTIDNVTVVAEDIDIESDPGDEMEADVPVLEEIAFVSEADQEFIGIISNAESDLGCTSLGIAQNDTEVDFFNAYCDLRSTKVFRLKTVNVIDSFDLTIFFKPSEVDGWSNAAGLNVLAVRDTLIDNLSQGFHIVPNEAMNVTDALSDPDGYLSLTFRTTGAYRTFALTDRVPYPISRTVTNTSDADIYSLRDRITTACPMDTIRFDPALFGDTIVLTGAEILIDRDIYILGPDVSVITVSAGQNGRVFQIQSEVAVSISNLTLCCGEAMGEADVLLNNGHLTLRDVEFHDD
jgi:hypothetical protein